MLMFRIRVRIDPERLRDRAETRQKRPAGHGLCADRSRRSFGRRSCKRAHRHERARRLASRASMSVTQRYRNCDRPRQRHARIPGGLSRRADRAGRRRQVDLVEHRLPAPGKSNPARFTCSTATWPMPRTAPRYARASPICRKASARTSIPTSASARTSNFSAACSANPASEREIAHRRAARQHRARAVCRPPGEETVGRDAAKARALLFADPRSRPSDPRRADDRRRSAVAPSVLGTDRSDAVAPPRNERRRRDRVYGRGRAVRLARRDERRHGRGGRVAGRAQADNRGANGRGCLHRPAAGAGARRSRGDCRYRRAGSSMANRSSRRAGLPAGSAISPRSTRSASRSSAARSSALSDRTAAARRRR